MEIINSLSEYRELVHKKCKFNKYYQYEKWIYRGQSNTEWKLIPNLWRNLKLDIDQEDISNINSLYKKTLNDFRNRINASKWKLPYDKPVLQLGQHYGLKTSLLDWTIDPAIALFFSLQESSIVKVFALKVNHNHVEFGELDDEDNFSIYDPLNLLGWNTVNYNSNMPEIIEMNSNIKAQKGLFTYYPKGNFDLNDSFKDSGNYEEFEIEILDKDRLVLEIKAEYPELFKTEYYLKKASYECNKLFEEGVSDYIN